MSPTGSMYLGSQSSEILVSRVDWLFSLRLRGGFTLFFTIISNLSPISMSSPSLPCVSSPCSHMGWMGIGWIQPCNDDFFIRIYGTYLVWLWSYYEINANLLLEMLVTMDLVTLSRYKRNMFLSIFCVMVISCLLYHLWTPRELLSTRKGCSLRIPYVHQVLMCCSWWLYKVLL